MSLLKCSECGGAVSSSAGSCPHCGTKNQKQAKPGCLIAIGAIFVIAVISDIIGANNPQSAGPGATELAVRQKLLDQCNQVITGFKTAGMIKNLSIESGAVMQFEMIVDQPVWDTLDFATKSGVADGAACIATSGDRNAKVEGDIFDNMNHNKIGEYDLFSEHFISDEK